MAQPDVDKRLKKLHRRAKLLDSQFSCCCGLLRFGLDSLIGLIPVIGDFAGVFLAVTYMNTIRRQFDIPATLASQMTLNIGIDFAVGLVPLLGDIVDTMFKANMRNYKIVEEYVAKSRADASLRTVEEGRAGQHHSKRDYLPTVPLRNAEHITQALANSRKK
ncbi:hypothetical protein DL89DRAFT_88912 [Linderina pennispora]|uniref:DUF4112 domain-containing protein n=1 Tax=Linderina pennispora TaxID=61395 RepID=A0A1Y1WHV8_9FUNG|nr:uncharacterized protein DL89DRAFT_88912 [Linderina pennispora]ORX73161.1 hypothetical protein DL89DRAFT_88912 [Linderina pennispora]